MRALESIASKQQIADSIILHLVVSKLDSDLQAKWEDSQSSSSSAALHLPSWDDLANFLERRCKSLEIYEHSPISAHREQHQNNRHRTNQMLSPRTQTASYVSTNQPQKCRLCNSAPIHSIFRCTKFVDLTVPDRFKAVKQLKLCLNCLGTNHVANSCPSLGRCRICNATHHTLLHKETPPLKYTTQGAGSSDATSMSTSNATSNAISNVTSNAASFTSPTECLQAVEEKSPVILATAVIELCSPSGTSMMVRALLDSCSQSNFITEAMAQRLRVPRKRLNINVSGIGGTNLVCAKHSCTLTAKSLMSAYAPTFEAVIISSISSCHPQQHIDISKWNIPANIKLADQNFNKPGHIDLLLGVDLFWDLLMIGKIKADNQPNFIKTKFGWVVSGSTKTTKYAHKSFPPYQQIQNNCSKRLAVLMAELNQDKVSSNNETESQVINTASNQPSSSSNEPVLEHLLQSFWSIENYGLKKTEVFSSEEIACENFFKETTRRCPLTNKFIVRLPFKEIQPNLGESRQTAYRRFIHLEARFARNKHIQREYNEFLDEYRSLNHMMPTSPGNARYYIPHHCVVKPESSTTRLRVVFDASSVTTNGKSLNDLLCVGPTLQADVFTILMRFRYHKFVLVADIVKMYRQIFVDDDDKRWQCILWRKNITDPLQTYELQTVTYGTSCAPYLAVKCLQQLAKEEATNFPIGSKSVLEDFYVDNLMTGSNTEDELIEIKRQVTALLKSGGFPLRKFASNSEYVLTDVAQTDRERVIIVDDIQYVKTLGLKWSPTDDVFHFSYPHLQLNRNVTKRSILAHMASFFDPLGFINPLIVRCKLLMQDLWKLKLHWDESVPHDVFYEWKQICDELQLIDNLRIPRYVKFNAHSNIHVFVDASTKAYGACIYVVTKHTNDKGSTLICAKSRVAPTKEVSLPRLELCAALLGSQLLASIIDQFPEAPHKIYCWSDSTITLSWIRGEAHRWPTFVSNRVTKIKQLTNASWWRHVPSELNPADMLSRGTTANTLYKSFWLHGPDFLLLEDRSWPIDHQPDSYQDNKDIINTFLTVTTIEDVISNHKYVNSYEKLLRIFTYVRRFINACRKQTSSHGFITVDELNASLLVICRLIQNVSFHEEITKLKDNKPLNRQSKLLQLSPFIHENVLRVGGRLKNSVLPFSTKHPILLPSSHPYVTTIVNYFHRKHLHAGPLTLHNILRDHFWIINGRNVIKKVVHNCILCYRCRPTTANQIMGSLPAHRVQQSHPFNISGVDYCGPFLVSSQIRGRGPKKVYLAIFICFSVKAVHFELVPDLTSSAFISALKRFISRRGHCSVIYSDNATNFIGGNRELRSLLHAFKSKLHNEMVQEACREEGIVWKLIPPRSPHFGGLWESAVKQAKHYIRRTIGNLVLTHDDFHTIICQAEAIINSRPLTPLSSDPSDLRPLTPGHFLVGRPLTTIAEPPISTINPTSLKRYQTVQWVQQQFWDRWRNEYLKQLQVKTKWTTTRVNLKTNDLVMLKEENIPPLRWPLARVIDCSPGDDGNIRVVTVKTADGIFKRAITKLCKLPLSC